jgi:hypothetical protein
MKMIKELLGTARLHFRGIEFCVLHVTSTLIDHEKADCISGFVSNTFCMNDSPELSVQDHSCPVPKFTIFWVQRYLWPCTNLRIQAHDSCVNSETKKSLNKMCQDNCHLSTQTRLQLRERD